MNAKSAIAHVVQRGGAACFSAIIVARGECQCHQRGAAADARSFKVIEGERIKVNFLIHYEMDQSTVKTALRLDEYASDDDSAWVLLEAVAGPSDV